MCFDGDRDKKMNFREVRFTSAKRAQRRALSPSRLIALLLCAKCVRLIHSTAAALLSKLDTRTRTCSREIRLTTLLAVVGQFLMVAAMLMPECSEVDKLRFWWWVMLFSDESSSDSSNSTSAARQAPIVPHRQVVQVATGASGEASAPLETLGRFFRDVLVSCTGLKIAKAIAVIRPHP